MTPATRSNNAESFTKTYESMSEGELLSVAAAYDSLVEPAQQAIRGEFARRHMEPPLAQDDDSEQVTSESLVTIRRYPDIAQAMVPRSMLESAGLYCFLQDENFLRVDWGAGIALGGLRLQVRPEDVAQAEQLLGQPIPEAIEYADAEDYIQPHCPRCGSIKVTSPAIYELNSQMPRGKESWRCDVCGCRWNGDGNDPTSKAV